MVDITVLCLKQLKAGGAGRLSAERNSFAVKCQQKLKSHLMEKTSACWRRQPEHEVRLIETASRKPAKEETPIKCEDICETLTWTRSTKQNDNDNWSGRHRSLWTGLKAKPTRTYTSHFPSLSEAEFTGRERVQLASRNLQIQRFQVVFILDGLDECRLPLGLPEATGSGLISQRPTSVDVLLTNLIRGDLLPSARIWITTRPAAANQIPAECVGMVTEVRGFTDPQKEDDETLARKIISHVKKSRTLHIMCHIPVFCWITATVMEDFFTHIPEWRRDSPTLVQSIQGDRKYHGRAETDPHWSPESKEIIVSLGKLAFNQLEKGNLIFYQADLRRVFTQIFKEELGCTGTRSSAFVHLSFQEFSGCPSCLCVLQKHWWSTCSHKNNQPLGGGEDELLYQSAVDKALLSENGHLTCSSGFLLGLSLETNQIPLRDQSGDSDLHQGEDRWRLSPERSINLFHCLNELKDRSLVEGHPTDVSPQHISPLLSGQPWVFILPESEEELDVFDLKKYDASEETLLRLLPVVKASKTSLLNGCKLSERGCEALGLSSQLTSSSLRELDLSNNDLQDSGVKLPLCWTGESTLLEWLVICQREAVKLLASVLSSYSSSRESWT
ncbi:NLR family CARD domain-containing protein 3 [Merluccius polli]|uniref:NLR family CARD domain-containing protein 3 n=1 Tax=Merluccius polli TaxID=89951 RepID=A0AA47N778_MERPO|nr:NLR family CARD domain-containing protein 3 [Merluccius polli]